MGHFTEIKKEFKDLRKRIDKYPVGAPESKQMYDVLKILFTEEEASMASMMPMMPATINKISKKTKVPAAKLEGMLENMAVKGLVMDFHNQKNDKTYYMLAPTVVGFFEFSLMRERSDYSQKELAVSMNQLFHDGPEFAQNVFQGNTQLARALVHETALSDQDKSEVLDWERATMLVETATSHAISHCYCRHKARHAGTACDNPEVSCMTIGPGVDWVVRRDLGRKVSKSESMDNLIQYRELGLVQIADNVQKEPSFICNCCGCCCGMLTSISHHGLKNAVHTSNFIATIDLDKCTGCGKCAKKCPIKAIEIKEKKLDSGKKKKWAVVDDSLCLGCGVCEANCKFESLSMKKRKQRVLTPVTMMEKNMMMAIERGKLENFIFDDMEDGPSAEFLKTFVGAVLNLPATKQFLLNEKVKSRYIEFLSGKSNF